LRRLSGSFPVTSSLIALNLLVYLVEIFCSGSVVGFDSRQLFDCGGVYGPAVVMGGEWWRLVAAIFLHGGLTHLLLNMVSLFIVGRMMERFFSRWSYLSIYLLAGIGGFVASLAVHPATVTVGASGAIFGIFGAIGGYFLFHRHRMGERFRMLVKEFAVILGLNLFLGLAIPGIDMSAHIAGFLLGGLGGYLAERSRGVYFAYLLLIPLFSTWLLTVWLPGKFTILYLAP